MLLRRVRNIILLTAAVSVAAPLHIAAGAAIRSHLYRALRAPHVIEIRNQSGADIVAASAAVCGSELRLANLAADGTATMRFYVECSGPYGIHVQLASGEARSVDDVAIGWWSRSHDVFTVTSGGTIRYQTAAASGGAS